MPSDIFRKPLSAYFFAALAILFWSTISTAFKLSLRCQTPTQLLLGACFFSALILLAIVIIRKKTGLLLQGSLKDIIRSAFLGFLNPFLYYTVLLEAYNRLPAQEAQALNYIWVVMLSLLSIPILKQKLSWRDITGVLISFCGAVVIAFRGNFTQISLAEPVGVELALASTLIWAVSWLLNVRDKRDTVVRLFWIFCFGLMYTTIYSVITKQFVIPGLSALEGEAYIGFFEMGITFMVWLMALQKASNTAKISNLIFITPFISMLIISLILKETIQVSTLAGLTLIIGGILWQQAGRKKQQPTEQASP